MSDRPPRDPEDLTLGGIVDEVVSQVKVALDEADVTSRRSRDLLLDGLRDVLEAMDPASVRGQGDPAPPDQPPPVPPDVEVVEGGRAEDAPPTQGPRPDLKVAEPEQEEAPTPAPKVVTRVVVKKSTTSNDGRPRVNLPEGGRWRSLFRGTVPRAYRIHALSGTARVQLNGLPADVLEEGDALDVEARVIQVGAQDGAAVVAYERLG